MTQTQSMAQAATALIEQKNIQLFQRQQQIALNVRIVETMDDEGNPRVRGCGMCSLLFGSKRGSVGGASASGSRWGKGSASERLSTANDAMRARAETLKTKLEESRVEIKQLMSQGRKQEALVVLKRSKPLEKQAAAAQSAADALETQIQMLEEAKLQREISSALSASVKSVKKKTKTLLTDAEKAVDGATEVKDLAEDVGAALEGLQPVDQIDEDDLLAELAELSEAVPGAEATARAREEELERREREVGAREEAARQDRLSALEAVRTAFPVAPTTTFRKPKKNEERSSLLTNGA